MYLARGDGVVLQRLTKRLMFLQRGYHTEGEHAAAFIFQHPSGVGTEALVQIHFLGLVLTLCTLSTLDLEKDQIPDLSHTHMPCTLTGVSNIPSGKPSQIERSIQ